MMGHAMVDTPRRHRRQRGAADPSRLHRRAVLAPQPRWHGHRGPANRTRTRDAARRRRAPLRVRQASRGAGRRASGPTGPWRCCRSLVPCCTRPGRGSNWPKVESVVGEIDVAHATGLVPCGTAAPLIVTVHDLAFVHDPAKFSRQGVRTMNRSLETIIRRADRVICSSEATRRDCEAAGIDSERLRLVPLGVDVVAVLDPRHRARPTPLPAPRRVRALRRDPRTAQEPRSSGRGDAPHRNAWSTRRCGR